MEIFGGGAFFLEFLSRWPGHNLMDQLLGGGIHRTAFEHGIEAVGFPIFACSLAALFLLNGHPWNAEENDRLQRWVAPVSYAAYSAFAIINECFVQPAQFNRAIQWEQLAATAGGLVLGTFLLNRINQHTRQRLGQCPS